MGYFGVITCKGCGQKATITPDKIITDGPNPAFLCRRCQGNYDIPEGFEFKHPSKKNLSVEEALRGGDGGEGLWDTITSFFKKGS